MRLYFVRHGESEANTRRIISNRKSSFALTALGNQQAQALAEKLRTIPFRALFSSPVLRARQTAEILSATLGVPYQVTEALREYDCGILEEQSDAESWKAHRDYYTTWMLRRNYESKPEGGESFTEVRERFVPFIDQLIHNSLYKDADLLLVGHGGLFHLMLPLILRNIDNEFVRQHGIGHTECVIAELDGDQLVCKQWADVQF